MGLRRQIAQAWASNLVPFPFSRLTTCPSISPPKKPTRRSGVYNDLGSGSNVDLCIITADDVEYLRNYEYLMDKTYSRKFPVTYAKGTARECPGWRMWCWRAAPRDGSCCSRAPSLLP